MSSPLAMSSLPASTSTPAPPAQHGGRRFSWPVTFTHALKAKFQAISFRRPQGTIGVGSRRLRSLAVQLPSQEMDSGRPTTPSSQRVQPDLSPFHAPPALAQPSSLAPSSSSALSSQQGPSRASSPTPTRTVKHWPWRPNVYARLKIRGQILPVRLAEVTSTPPPDRPRDFGGSDWYNVRFWACVYIDDLDYCWWAFTTAIILFDEILRHPVHENVLDPTTAEIKSLVDALRALRDAVASDENYGGSRLWLPLSSGETLDEAMSATHVCQPRGDTFNEVLHYSRNPGFFNNGINVSIVRAYDLCKNLHASSELLYFGDLPQEAMSRVEAYIKTGGRALRTESQGMKFFMVVLQLVVTQQGQRQYESATLYRALDVPGAEIVGAGAYGQIFKVTHPYWGALAVKEPLPRNVPEQDNNEITSHFGIAGHPNILPLVAWANHQSQVVAAMQWAENGSMNRFLARNPDSSRVLLLITVATALQHLHESHRIHGDLHMGNIVISKNDEAFLCDFGLSKIVDDVDAQDDTAGGTVSGGVPIYMAPELYEPRARRTFASEVFAFGMVIFQTYSGTRPFVLMANNEAAQHDAAIVKAIANGTRPTRDQVTRDDFSDEMWNLVQDCWKQDPAQRPSMDQVVTRMLHIVPTKDLQKFHMRARPIELTLFRPGDVALDDAMRSHEDSAELRWTLSCMEHFGLKKFFANHVDARHRILMSLVAAMLSGSSQVMDVKECGLEVMLRLYEVTKKRPPSSDSPD